MKKYPLGLGKTTLSLHPENVYTMPDYLNHDYFNFQRRISSVVSIGDIPLGGTNPVRLQSMTNTPTHDIKSTVEQCKRVFDEGADYMRITTPTVRDAETLEFIKKELHNAGYKGPLVADVHFNPAVAEVAARIVEKVRINPGNYADKKKFEKLSFTDDEYRFEIERIHDRIRPLLTICKEYGTAIRIGVNHGSLSDRIINRYGDTPEGMVESAMEFLRLFELEGFKETVISMKSSNTRVMVYSTRLLIAKMLNEGMNYPVHLGVTEAGEGEDGIIKSAVGIGALLADGIGETIRVSLTGNPEQEIPVARSIIRHFSLLNDHAPIYSETNVQFSPFEYKRRPTLSIAKVGSTQSPKVIITAGNQDTSLDKNTINPDDSIYISENVTDSFSFTEITSEVIECPKDFSQVFVYNSEHPNVAGTTRAFIARLQNLNNNQPLVLRRKYNETNLSDLQIKAACDFGALLTDGLLDGIWIENLNSSITNAEIYTLALNILQASRLRMSKTEYISCPSCGRTLFDLTATTASIRERTQHLKHLKIGIMGCIVNGPGEMADADFGYVGSGPGKITLYKNKEIIKRNIPEGSAVDELIELIKRSGEWKEP